MPTPSPRLVLGVLAVCVLTIAPVMAQGPGSAGFHLDIIADQTSTYSSIADAPYAPGSGFGGYPTGTAGNPYQAYATPGSTIRMQATLPVGTLGPAPTGAGSLITIMFSLGTPFIPLSPAGLVPPANAGQPIILVTAPPFGTLIDGVGVLAAPPALAAMDPGYPNKFTLEVQFPSAPLGAAVLMQAVALSPGGTISVSNGVALLAGPNPNETSLLASMTACGPFTSGDEGFTDIASPPGFTFYGFPQPTARVVTNPFVEFVPFGVGVGVCDPVGTPADLGCPLVSATASPRIAVNHYNANFSLTPPGGRTADITLEIAPAAIGLPSRHIIRWKNGPHSTSPAPFPDTDFATQVLEMWGDNVQNAPVNVPNGPNAPQVDGRSRIVVVRQEIHALTTTAMHGQMGIGPGLSPIIGPCTPLAFWTLYNTAPFVSAPFEAVSMDSTTLGPAYPLDSHTQTSRALVFDTAAVPPTPGIYVIQDY